MPESNPPLTITLPASVTQQVTDAAQQYATAMGTDLQTMVGGFVVMLASPQGQAMMSMLQKGPMGKMLQTMAANFGR